MLESSQYGIRIRNTRYGSCPKASMRNTDTEYGIRFVPQSRNIKCNVEMHFWVNHILYSASASRITVSPIRNTDTEYGIRFMPQSLNTEYGYGIRDTVRAPKPGYTCILYLRLNVGPLWGASCIPYSVSVFRILGLLWGANRIPYSVSVFRVGIGFCKDRLSRRFRHLEGLGGMLG